VTAQTLGRKFISDGWKIGERRQPLCMGIVWTEISSEKIFSSMTRTKIHVWRTDLTIDLIIVVIELQLKKTYDSYSAIST
jgi:hypothetical protein